MTDRKLLLAAIREAPGEDTPRLAHADFLEERGHEEGNSYFLDWAALIRAQVEFARAERHSDRWFELARRQAELFGKRKEWSPLWGGRLGRAAVRRGFREAHVYYPATERFLANFDLAATGNPIRALKLPGLEEAGKATVAALARHPALGWVETLDVGSTRPALARKFLTVVAPRMPRLRALGLGSLRLTAAAAGDLLAALALPGLAALDLSDNMLFGSTELPAYRAESLFHSPALAGVRWLDLFRTNLTGTAVHALAHSPVIRGLRYLNLASAGYAHDPALGPAGAALAFGPAVRGVEVLSLSRQRIGPAGVEALLRTPFLSTVRELDLEGNELGDAGAVALASSPHAAALRKLNLDGNGIGREGAAAILASPHLAGLRILNLAPETGPEHRRPLADRFPDREPPVPGVHGAEFFEPIP